MAIEGSSDTTSYDDSCPLLLNDSLEAQKPPKAKYTPLPRTQLAALCIIRLVDPIAFTQIFPYINQFMDDLHVTNDPSQIGFYSGLVESSFAIAQMLSIYQWAKLSDTIGRRPVVLIGILGISLTTLFFGLSKTLASVIIVRSIGGFFSGNIAVIHSVLGELTDSTNQATAYPIYGLFWPIGAVVGPLIGGTLSNPAAKIPEYFDYEFLRNNPYFMPCFISALIGILSTIWGYLSLDETLPSKRRYKSEKSTSSTYGSTQSAEVSPSRPEPSATFKSLLSIPIIFALSASGCALSFIATAFDVVFVLFCYTPVKAGGLSFSASQIGYSLAMAGGISVFIQLFIMPFLLRRFDNARMYNACMAIWPCTFVVLPFLNTLAMQGYDPATGEVSPQAMTMVWIGIGVITVMTRIAILAYSLSMLLIKEYAPSPSTFGAANGLVNCAMCFARAFSPAFVSSCFALSMENNLLGGYLWVLIMVIISMLGCTLSRTIVQGQ